MCCGISIRHLPGGSIAGVQIGDRPVDAPQSSSTAVSERLLPGEGAAPLGELVSAILETPPASTRKSRCLARNWRFCRPIARALEAWRIAVWDRRAGDAKGVREGGDKQGQDKGLRCRPLLYVVKDSYG
jgi:hypothetical protein